MRVLCIESLGCVCVFFFLFFVILLYSFLLGDRDLRGRRVYENRSPRSKWGLGDQIRAVHCDPRLTAAWAARYLGPSRRDVLTVRLLKSTPKAHATLSAARASSILSFTLFVYISYLSYSTIHTLSIYNLTEISDMIYLLINCRPSSQPPTPKTWA